MTTNPAPTAPGPASQGARLPFWGACILACVLMFANYALMVPLSLIPQFSLPRSTPQPVWDLISMVLCAVVLATALWLLRLVSRLTNGDTLADMGWRWGRNSWWQAVLGWAAVSACIVAGQAIAAQLPGGVRLPEWSRPDLSPVALTSGVLLGIAQGVVMQGIPEELVWRGWLMRCLAQRPRTALAVSALAFGCMHVVSQGGQQGAGERLVYCLQAAGFALLAGALALRLRSLWAAIGVHAGMHLTYLIADFIGPVAEGPAVWATEMVLMAATALAVLWRWTGSQVLYDR